MSKPVWVRASVLMPGMYFFGGHGDKPEIKSRDPVCFREFQVPSTPGWYAWLGEVPPEPEMPDEIEAFLESSNGAVDEWGRYRVKDIVFDASTIKGKGWLVYSNHSKHFHLLCSINTAEEAKLIFKALKLEE